MTMKQFRYQITMHSAKSFKDLVYFCSEEAHCQLEEVPSDQIGRLETILNEQGQKGWELAQATFGKEGMMIFWKKAVVNMQTSSEG